MECSSETSASFLTSFIDFLLSCPSSFMSLRFLSFFFDQSSPTFNHFPVKSAIYCLLILVTELQILNFFFQLVFHIQNRTVFMSQGFQLCNSRFKVFFTAYFSDVCLKIFHFIHNFLPRISIGINIYMLCSSRLKIFQFIFDFVQLTFYNVLRRMLAESRFVDKFSDCEVNRIWCL
jgi:hypothetical protein